MKKVLFAVALVSVSFVACNDEKKTEETKTSDTSVVVTPTTPTADTTLVVKDTTVKTSIDTLKK